MYIHLSCLLGQYQLRIILFFLCNFLQLLCRNMSCFCLVFVFFLVSELPYFCPTFAVFLSSCKTYTTPPYINYLRILRSLSHRSPIRFIFGCIVGVMYVNINCMNALPPFSHSFYFWLYSGGHVCKYKLYECSPTVLPFVLFLVV